MDWNGDGHIGIAQNKAQCGGNIVNSSTGKGLHINKADIFLPTGSVCLNCETLHC